MVRAVLQGTRLLVGKGKIDGGSREKARERDISIDYDRAMNRLELIPAAQTFAFHTSFPCTTEYLARALCLSLSSLPWQEKVPSLHNGGYRVSRFEFGVVLGLVWRWGMYLNPSSWGPGLRSAVKTNLARWLLTSTLLFLPSSSSYLEQISTSSSPSFFPFSPIRIQSFPLPYLSFQHDCDSGSLARE